MKEINFIRPQEVFDRNTGESKVRYTSYDGSDRFIPVVDGEDGVPRTLVVTTHAELVTMRDAGKLTPGALYRITDYQCTTTQENTRSAGHQFDIVLLALSENKLAEEGWAMMHENDTYFANSNLFAWKVWYCLDNDKSRFVWADEENGKGVIYRLIDEFNNDIKYDFKNIQFKRKLANGQYDATKGTDTWCYTLNLWYKDMCQDASIVGNTLPNDEGFVTGVYDNVFGYCTAYDLPIEGVNTFAFALGNNVVLSFDDGGYFGIHSNTIGNSFYDNTIGNSFYDNTIGNNFFSNTIGNNFFSNTIGNNFNSNTVGNDFYSNTVGNDFFSNTVGNNFFSNTIGNNFNSNTVGNDFYSNTVGNSFISKTISDNTSAKNYGNNGVELATKS